MLTLTDKAVAEVRRIMSDQGLSAGAVLRFSVAGGGCSGFSYVMEFEQDGSQDGDVTTEFSGLPVALASDAVPYLDNTVVDFNDDPSKRGFTFENPNASGTCGCGSSFSV